MSLPIIEDHLERPVSSPEPLSPLSPPPTPSGHGRSSILEERSNKEFIRRLANDYIHFKIFGANTPNNPVNNSSNNDPSMLSPRSPRSPRRLRRSQGTSTGAYSDRSSLSADSNNNTLTRSMSSQILLESRGASEGALTENINIYDNEEDDEVYLQNSEALNDEDQLPEKQFRKASRVLRKVSVELERSHSAFFDNVCDDLTLSRNDPRTTFRNVSDRVLNRDSLNWGRVVSLFTFGGKLAEWFWNTHQEEKIEEVEEWLAESLSSKEGWIEENGGWVSVD